MAALTGKGGEIRYGAKAVFRMNHWDLSMDTNVLDVTAWTTSAAAWRSNLAGLQGWSGSVSGYWDVSGDSSGQGLMHTRTLTPTTGTLIMYVSGSAGENYRGDVILNRLNPSADIDGTVNLSFDYTGNGALTYSTAT